jgi:AcrR family transcriptional regulator
MSADTALTVESSASAGDLLRDKRDRVIERAIVMFNEFGYERVRISDITESLNMGKGTFYLYFENKRDLLLSCFRYVGVLVDELQSLPGISRGDFFTKIGPRMETIGAYEWWPGLFNLLRAGVMSTDLTVKAAAREAYDTITSHLRRELKDAIEAGKARDVDVDLAVYGYIGLSENLWFRCRLDDSYTADQVKDVMVDAIGRWLAAGESLAEGSQSAEDRRSNSAGRRSRALRSRRCPLERRARSRNYSVGARRGGC